MTHNNGCRHQVDRKSAGMTSTTLILHIPLILISSLGILFNGYIVTAVLLTRQVTTANNILLLHLGTIDVILGILFLIFAVPNGYSKHGWLTEGFPCTMHGFLHTLLHPLALWTICGLNCDRYYAIAAPLHYSHIVNAKKVLIGLGLGWLISLLLCVPPLFAVAPYGYVSGLGACTPNFQLGGAGTLWYSVFYTIFTLLLPATLIICCNLKILMIARYHRHRIASAIYEVTLSAQVTITHQRNPFFVPTVTAPNNGGPPKFRGRSAIYSVLQLVGSLVILYIPYYSLTVWESINASLHQKIESINRSSTIIHPQLFTITMYLLICSPSINAFLYGVKNKQLRTTFKNYWRKKQTKSEVNQEIQARTPSTCGSRRPSLTPLGFLTKQPTLQRRLSEAFLDKTGNHTTSPQKHKIKRITTELSWRPSSANSLNFLPKDETKRIKQTTSCNTLQVPNSDTEISTITEDIPIKSSNNNRLSPNSFILKFFNTPAEPKKFEVVQNLLDSSPKRRSPRITITRTYSEESSDNSRKETIITRKHSTSSTTLLERKWRQLKDNSNTISGTNDSSGGKQVNIVLIPTAIPLLDNSSDSSLDLSDESGKIFMALDQQHERQTNENGDEEEEEEDEILLSWPHHYCVIKDGDDDNIGRGSNKPTGFVQSNINKTVQSQDI